jgi:hypothetical protein
MLSPADIEYSRRRDIEFDKQQKSDAAAKRLRIQREFARKEKEIGRKLNDSERNFYTRFGAYPASEQQRVKRMDFDELERKRINGYWDGEDPYANEIYLRVHQYKQRTPLENAIRRWFTPVKNQIPEKYLK